MFEKEQVSGSIWFEFFHPTFERHSRPAKHSDFWRNPFAGWTGAGNSDSDYSGLQLLFSSFLPQFPSFPSPILLLFLLSSTFHSFSRHPLLSCLFFPLLPSFFCSLSLHEASDWLTCDMIYRKTIWGHLGHMQAAWAWSNCLTCPMAASLTPQWGWWEYLLLQGLGTGSGAWAAGSPSVYGAQGCCHHDPCCPIVLPDHSFTQWLWEGRAGGIFLGRKHTRPDPSHCPLLLVIVGTEQRKHRRETRTPQSQVAKAGAPHAGCSHPPHTC